MSLSSSNKVVDAAEGQKASLYFLSLMFELIKDYKKDDSKESMTLSTFISLEILSNSSNSVYQGDI